MQKLYLVWYEPNSNVLNKIGILKRANSNYIFEYINYEENELQLFSKKGLFPGFLDLNKTYKNNDLFENIKMRLPSKNRIDYNELLKDYKIINQDDDFEILEKTKGKISADFFIFVSEKELKKLETEN